MKFKGVLAVGNTPKFQNRVTVYLLLCNSLNIVLHLVVEEVIIGMQMPEQNKNQVSLFKS